jgi:hypothetical protein
LPPYYLFECNLVLSLAPSKNKKGMCNHCMSPNLRLMPIYCACISNTVILGQATQFIKGEIII